MFSFFDLPNTRTTHILVIDVGAMNLGAEIHAPLTRGGRAGVLGFEPVISECDKLNEQRPADRRYLPLAIGDGSRHAFHICNYPMTSSLYEPNTSLVSLYQSLGELMRVTRSVDLKTTRLDDINEARQADFLKLDVQGAELGILLGAPITLSHTLVVHTEVEFVPLYSNQPLFAEVDQELRRRGFYFHRFHSLMGRPLKPLSQNNDLCASMGQTLWGDAVYVRDPQRLDELTPDALLKLAAIAHEVYASYDYTARVLEFHDRKTNSGLYREYLLKLTGQDVAVPVPA